jgi:hypothetical protein
MLGPTVSLASPSWRKAPIWGLRPDLYYCWTLAGLLTWGALSDERTGLSFARLSQQYEVFYQYVQFAFFKLLNECIYNIRPLSVRAQYSSALNLYSLITSRHRQRRKRRSFVAVPVLHSCVAAVTCLPSRCLETAKVYLSLSRS